MPLGHVSLPTSPSTYKPMRDFYTTTLSPLGYTIYQEQDKLYCGWRTHMGPDFWLHCGGDDTDFATVDSALSAEENRKKLFRDGRTHVAFNVGSRRQVEEWFRNAV
jgi:hypothetical protein